MTSAASVQYPFPLVLSECDSKTETRCATPPVDSRKLNITDEISIIIEDAQVNLTLALLLLDLVKPFLRALE